MAAKVNVMVMIEEHQRELAHRLLVLAGIRDSIRDNQRAIVQEKGRVRAATEWFKNRIGALDHAGEEAKDMAHALSHALEIVRASTQAITEKRAQLEEEESAINALMAQYADL